MKKKLAMITAVLLICLTAAPTVFGAGLTVESIYPDTDEKGLQTVNQMARIVFSGEIDVEANKDYFKIVDPKGKEQAIMVLEQEDEPNRVNLLLEKDLTENTTYTIVIDGAVTDREGNELGKEYTSSFTTRSQRTDTIVTTIMMFIMFGAVIVLTLRDQQKQQREQEEAESPARKRRSTPIRKRKKAAARRAARAESRMPDRRAGHSSGPRRSVLRGKNSTGKKSTGSWKKTRRKTRTRNNNR